LAQHNGNNHINVCLRAVMF